MKSILCCLLLSLAVVSFHSGCGTSARKRGEELAATGQTVFSVSVPQGADMEEVGRGIDRVLGLRGWTVSDNDDGSKSATLVHRGISGRITVRYDAEAVLIEDDSSTTNGEPLVPLRWIRFLLEDLRVYMTTLK